VPTAARPRPVTPQLVGDQRAQFEDPAAHRLIGEVEPALGQQPLDIAVAQRETQIEPDRVLYDVGGNPWRRYENCAMPDPSPPSARVEPVAVTIPFDGPARSSIFTQGSLNHPIAALGVN